MQQSLTQRTEAFNAEGDRSKSFLTAEWLSLQNILLHVINPHTFFRCFIATGSQQRWPSKILSTFIDLTVHVIQPCPVFASWSQSVVICKFLTGSALSEEDICITFTHPHFWSQCVSKDSQQREPSKIIPFKDLTHPVYASWLQPVTICMLQTARALGEENIPCYSPTHPYLYHSPILNSPIFHHTADCNVFQQVPHCAGPRRRGERVLGIRALSFVAWAIHHAKVENDGQVCDDDDDVDDDCDRRDQASTLRCISKQLCQCQCTWTRWSSLWWLWCSVVITTTITLTITIAITITITKSITKLHIADHGTKSTKPPAPVLPTSTPTTSGQCRPQISTKSLAWDFWSIWTWTGSCRTWQHLNPRSISLHHVGHDQLHNAGHDQTDSLTKKGSGSLGESWTLNWSNMV